MNARLNAPVVAVLLLAGTASAQSLEGQTASPMLTAGTRVRLGLQSGADRISGTVIGMDEKTVTVSVGGSPLRIPLDSVVNLHVSLGRERQWLKGFSAGALGGIGLGFAYPVDADNCAADSPNFCSRGQAMLASTLAWGGIGAAVGAFIKRERWMPVPAAALVASAQSAGLAPAPRAIVTPEQGSTRKPIFELGALGGIGGVSILDAPGVGGTFADVGMEFCALCGGRFAIFAEYRHLQRANDLAAAPSSARCFGDRGRLVACRPSGITDLDMGGAGMRIQRRSGAVRPFADVGAGGGRDRFWPTRSAVDEKRSHGMGGLLFGAGATVGVAQRWYLRPQLRGFFMSIDHAAVSAGLGAGVRF
jgi:hypothetical protein